MESEGNIEQDTKPVRLSKTAKCDWLAGSQSQPEQSISIEDGSEMRTSNGFFRAQTHEKTTDLSLLVKVLYEKRNVNKDVEDELAEFRREIELKYEQSTTKSFVLDRHLLQ